MTDNESKFTPEKTQVESAISSIREKIAALENTNLRETLSSIVDELAAMPNFTETEKSILEVSDDEIIINGIRLQQKGLKQKRSAIIPVGLLGFDKRFQILFDYEIMRSRDALNYFEKKGLKSNEDFSTLSKKELGIDSDLADLIIKKTGRKVSIRGDKGNFSIVPANEAAFYGLLSIHTSPHLGAIKEYCEQIGLDYINFLRDNKEAIISTYWADMDEAPRKKFIEQLEELTHK